MKNQLTMGHLAAIFTVLIWSTTYISTKILLVDFDPVEIMVYRFIAGFALLFFLAGKPLKLKEKKHELLFIAAGLCGVALYFTLQNLALTYTYASNAGVVISTAPFFTAILTHILLKNEERLHINFFVGFLVAMTGIILISFNGAKMELNPLGDLLTVAAAVTWGFYSVFTKKIANLGYDNIKTIRKVFFYGLLFMIPIVLLMGIDFSPEHIAESENLFHILYLGLGASAICFITWNYAIRVLGAVKTGVYIYLEPAITVVTSMFILDEIITPLAILGTALTMAGLVLSEWKFKRKQNRCQ
ncbi:MAG: DMT family transporter [Firmicutes bacterium]|nr:DMT family transporter [Bacillota bacterium]